MFKTWASVLGFLILMVTAAVWAAPVPDTGQTKCYDVEGNVIACPSSGQALYGQDANYTINPMSYTKLDGNGNILPDSATSWTMVKDNITGLIWEVKTKKDGVKNYNDPHDADNTYTWYDSNPATNGGDAGTPGDGTDTEDFIKSLNDARYGGYSNWRMPTIKELAYIVKYSISNPGPTIDTRYFPDTVSFFYWSSNTHSYATDGAGGVNFGYGYDGYDNKYDDYYVRAVCGEKSGSLGNYTNNGDGTVTDTSSGLMWQQGSTGSTMTWEQALSYCENLNLGGHTDWRLPTIKELRSLADYSLYHPAINKTYFPDTVSSFYLSSTTGAGSTGLIWGVNFYYGYDNLNGKHDYYSVRAVRSADNCVLAVSPTNRDVANAAGAITFDVSNTGTGTMPWTATVTSGGDWLEIQSGASGTDTGTITCSFGPNTDSSVRTGTIRVTAIGATGSPADVTVNQASTLTIGLKLIINQIDATNCTEVKSIVTVTDMSGNPVIGLTASNFIVTEDNVYQSPITVKPVSSLIYLPMAVALTMDYSGSMNGQPLIDVQNAAAAFVTQMGSEDQAEIIKFSDSVSVVQPFTTDKALLASVAKSSWYGTGGRTALYDSIYRAVADTALQGGRMAVIAMTDGDDNASSHELDEIIIFAKSSGVPVFTIGLGSVIENVLKKIASETGGAYYYAPTSSDLLAIYQKISKVLNNQYIVTYTTAKSDGLNHTVVITATINGASGMDSKVFNACEFVDKDACTAVLSSDLKFHIPMIKYQTLVGTAYIWLDMQYIPTADGNVLMRMTAGDWVAPDTTCVPASIATDLDLDIYDLLFYNTSTGSTHYWATFSYFPTSDGNIWFRMTNAGAK